MVCEPKFSMHFSVLQLHDKKNEFIVDFVLNVSLRWFRLTPGLIDILFNNFADL